MHAYETQVNMSQVGTNGLMRIHSLVGIMQDCSMQWLETEPVMRDWMRDDKIIMVVTSRQVDVIRYPRMGEALKVVTSVYGYKSYLGYRNTCVYDSDGNIVAKCWCMGAWVDTAGGKATKIPEEVLESLLVEDEVAMEKLPRKIKMPQDAPLSSSSVVAMRSDTDLFGHVNNAQYIRIAWDMIPEDIAPGRMRVEHKAQAKPGQTIIAKRWNIDGKEITSLESPEGEVYSAIEFSNF